MVASNTENAEMTVVPSEMHSLAESRFRLGHVLIPLLASILLFSASPYTFAATPDSGAVQFEINGVGAGIFAHAVIASNPGKGGGQNGTLCVTLEGGSRDNSPALITWLTSNSAGVALATKPDAILKVSSNEHGLRSGTYHLTRVTVDDYTKKADQDLSHPRLEGLKVKCETLLEPASS